MGKKKKSRENYRFSSGLKRQRKFNQLIRRLNMKINRWKRYAEEINSGKKSGKIERWNVMGLEKQIKFLESCNPCGPKQRKKNR